MKKEGSADGEVTSKTCSKNILKVWIYQMILKSHINQGDKNCLGYPGDKQPFSNGLRQLVPLMIYTQHLSNPQYFDSSRISLHRAIIVLLWSYLSSRSLQWQNKDFRLLKRCLSPLMQTGWGIMLSVRILKLWAFKSDTAVQNRAHHFPTVEP